MMTPKRNGGSLTKTGLSTLAIILALAGGAYALMLLTVMTGEISAMSAKLDKLDAMIVEIRQLTAKVRLLEDTNRRLGVMEGYMQSMPELTRVADGALQQAISSNRKLDVTNDRLAGTRLFMRQTAVKLDVTNAGLKHMDEQLAIMRGSIESMSQKLATLDDMRRLLVETNANMAKMSGGLDAMQAQLKSMNTQLAALSDMKTSLDLMQAQIKIMTTQLAVLPDVKQGLDAMQTQLKTMNTQLTALAEMKQSLDTMLVQLKGMNTELTTLSGMTRNVDAMQEQLKGISVLLARLDTSMQQMTRTTQEMAKSLKKLPAQGALGVAILAGAELIGK